MPSKNKTPRLSIVIPAYKASKTIGVCLLSVMFTRPRASEVLVLLDGPGTHSRVLDLLEKFGAIKVFKRQLNQGISSSMNFLVETSKAPVVARMDADDICLPGRFKKGLRLIEVGNSDFVFGHAILFGPRVRPFFLVPQFPVALDQKTSLLAAALRNPFVNSTVVFRKSAFMAVGGCSDSIAEDFELFLRAQVEGFRFRVLRRFQILYRVHDNIHTTQENFQFKVENDALLNKAIREQRSFVASKFNLASDDSSLKLLIERCITERSFGYRFRTLYLNRFMSFVLSLTKVR
jgi:glycosyltransferase involved in cell wall biosynthesis